MTENKIHYNPDDIHLYLEFWLLLQEVDTNSVVYTFLYPQLKNMAQEIFNGVRLLYPDENGDSVGSIAWVNFLANLQGVNPPEGLPKQKN